MYTLEERDRLKYYLETKKEYNFTYFTKKNKVLFIVLFYIFVQTVYIHMKLPVGDIKTLLIVLSFFIGLLFFTSLKQNESQFRIYQNIIYDAIEITLQSGKVDMFLKKQIRDKIKQNTKNNVLPDFSSLVVTCLIQVGDKIMFFQGQNYEKEKTYTWNIPLIELPEIIMKNEIDNIKTHQQ